MNEHERAELARLLPPPARPELSSDRHRLLRGHLMSEIRDTKPARVRRGKLGWVAIPALAGGLALAMVLPGGSDGAASKAPLAQQQSGQQVQGEQPAENGSTTLNVAPVAAVQLLTQAADTAAGKPDPKPGKNQFVYVDSLVSFAGTNANGETHVDKAHRRQIWLSVDGSQRGLLKEEGKFGKGEAAAKEGDKRPAPSPDGGLWLDPTKKPSIGAPTYNYLAGLPTDPDALLKKIYAETKGQGRTPDQEAFATIGDLLREQIAPPAVSAALYRAAAKIPGVTAVEDSVDASGRHGVAVAHVDSGVRTEWIFDPKTHEFLGEREVVVAEGDFGKPGTVIGHTAVLGRSITDKPGDEPKQTNA
ncbi:CU044_5270 family protein [Kitasatospora purpeofusca]|uniref:CU044_5270 family protein n=1 Tax=Kitasatospora purpeofusca TaxID=67352 RepID=UPI0022582E6E|nr:CU044_5270 family protein [Kitasatospora purpeofusca]MCX4685799.1 CU044_5270 family protein [Kitasatospora purpeofusca]